MKNILFTLALLVSFVSFGQTAEEYIDMGRTAKENGDYYVAINNYTKALQTKPSSSEYEMAIWGRGHSKVQLGDFSGALKDLSELPDDEWDWICYYKGLCKFNLEDYYGAVGDYSNAIKLNSEFDIAFKSRGDSKEQIGDLVGACNDWKKAVKLGYQDASKLVTEKCN
tara:strand:+ start:86 stop:589 length:504 start_codon:yes stop_codon:yes gene_type:complete